MSRPLLTWGAWQTLPTAPLSPSLVAEILDGGQAFRWTQHEGLWTGTWASYVCQLRSLTNGALQWRCPGGKESEHRDALLHYWGDDADLQKRLECLPWRSDPVLARALRTFAGLRLLRQPLGETLLCFLCSATKQIPQIKQMVALLAQRHGTEIAPGIHRLPTWSELATVAETDLRTCQLGFRARYVAGTAAFLARHPAWLTETAALPYPAARDALCQLPGVGEKVADCVLLFSGAHPEAFPVDTWILKVLAAAYGLQGWKPPQVAHFGRCHFGRDAGLAQQYLFSYVRAQAKQGLSVEGALTGPLE